MKKLFQLIFITISVNTYAQIDSTICCKINKTQNEFDKQIVFETPLLRNCSLIKVISEKNNQTAYYLSLSATGLTFNVNTKGVKIILSNGQIVSFPAEKIEVSLNDNGYNYSCFIQLTKDKIEILKKFKIKKWQLYIYENEQDEIEAEEIRIMLNCLIKLNSKSIIPECEKTLKMIK